MQGELQRSVDQNTAIKEKMFSDLLIETFGSTEACSVMDASGEPLEMKVLIRVDSNYRVALCVGQIKFTLDTEVINTYKKMDSRVPISYSAITFIFEEKKFLILHLPHGDVYKSFLFFEKGANFIGMVKRARQIYASMNRKTPHITVYGGGQIPLKDIENMPFVPPTNVMEIWDQRIKPQLDAKSVYNHVIFFGPPGSGKTAFCRWVATKYPKWNFIFVPPHMATEPGNISRAFHEAKYKSPAVVVFEDIDLVGHSRRELSEGFTPLLGELLTQVDGVEPRETVLAIASTNNIAALDPAVIRHGRFGIHMELTYTTAEKAAIIRSYYPTMPMTDEQMESYLRRIDSPVNLKMIAKLCQVIIEFDKEALTTNKFAEVVKQISEDKVAKYIKKTQSVDIEQDEDDNTVFITTHLKRDN
jgi:hypothetical protein